MKLKKYFIFSILVVIFSVSCASRPDEDVTRVGDEVTIESKDRRYVMKIVEDEIHEAFLVYGFVWLSSSRADVSVMSYSRAKDFKKKYGDVGNCDCKSACGRQWKSSLQSLAFYSDDESIREALDSIGRLKGIALIKIKYEKMQMDEGFKKTRKGEVKYRRVTLPYPYYFVTDVKIINDDYSFKDDLPDV
jgi:hypothetical protein